MSNKKIHIGITHGDTNGIGYEVILKLLEDPRIADLCTITLYGSAKAAAFYRKAMELPQVQLNKVESAADAKEGVFNVVNVVGEDLKIDPGMETEAAGAAALAALDAACADIKNGVIDALVTAPINKHSIQSPSFTFPGHTEYLEASFSNPENP
ncbi:MAG: 4-hydroxythreonine-4-phosphate dehydrogenase PdxA, partial [Muribaculaceae bacterium]|nr:4-hydroxythreonine-4-phosphate dehydrogenase PdxA [Muribaculaceae bacterium]